MGPIRGQTRPLPVAADIVPEVQRFNAKLNASIHNRFDIEVINAETGKVRQRAQAENVICNQLWSNMFNSYDSTRQWNNYIHVGTGTGTPSTADTSLFNFRGYGTPSTSNDVYSLNNSTGVLSLKRKITLLETQYVGSTLTEVGIGSGTSSGTLCTHAMLKDMNGNQISIVKTSTDIINIYSTVFVHWNAAGISNTHCIFESTTDPFVQWLLGLSTGSPIWYAIFYNGNYTGNSMSKGNYGSSTDVNFAVSFNASNKTLTQTISRMAAADGNFTGGINSIKCPPFAIPLSNDYTITGESIGTGDGSAKDFFTDFGIANAPTIYVDGAVSGDVTVDIGAPVSTELGWYFIKCDSTGTQYPYESGAFYKYYSHSSGDTRYAYNPFYAIGVKSFTSSVSSSLFNIYASDDFTTWNKVTPAAVQTAYAHCKYWKAVHNYVGDSGLTVTSLASGNVHFASAPSNGAAITGTYTTKSIPKDINHVFDFSIAVQLGEHTA